MATKTSNGAGGGSWSAGATWQGGIAPVDGDTVVIAAGDTVTFDADLSAWTTGVAGLTITGTNSGQPATLQCSTSPGVYVLPIKTGTKLQGTNNTVLGRLYAGSAGTPLPNTVKFTIKLMGTGSGGQIDRTYLFVLLYCTQPAHRWIKLSADEAAGQTILSVDTDVTGDIWTDGDILAICNVNKTADYQRTTIAAGGIAPTTITVTNSLDSLNIAGSYLVRVTRNIEITAEGSQVAVYSSIQTSQTGTWNCAVRQTGSVQGYGFRSGLGGIIGGVVNGFSYGIDRIDGIECSGCLVGGSGGIVNVSGAILSVNLSGLVAGFTYGLSALSGGEVSGIVAGCIYGLYASQNIRISGVIHGCNLGAVLSLVEVTGSIVSCTYGLGGGYGATSGVLRRGSVIGGSGADANNFDVTPFNGIIRGYGTQLRSATPMNAYISPKPNHMASCILYDLADASGDPQPGRMRWWTPYGYGITEDFNEAVHESPPVPLEYVYKQTMLNSADPDWVEVPIWGEKNVPLVVRIYIRKAHGCMTEPYGAALIDPDYAFGDPAAELAKVLGWEDSDWQTLTLSCTPTHDRQLMLRVFGEDDDNGWLYWNFDVRTLSRRPRPRLMGV